MSDATNLTVDYLQLLVTQLSNQNPLDPMDANDMSAQLAQFSQVSELEELNSTFSDTLGLLQQNYAGSLLGQEVSYLVSDGEEITTETGTVTEIGIADDEISLLVGSTVLTLDDILTVGASS